MSHRLATSHLLPMPMRSASPFQFGRVTLNPAVNRGVIDMQSAFQHHRFQIAVAQRIPQIPTDAQENDVGLEMTPFERLLFGHTEPSFALFHRIYQIGLFFATQPVRLLRSFWLSVASRLTYFGDEPFFIMRLTDSGLLAGR